MNLNKSMIAGNLTRDPELKTTPNGAEVANFTLAVNRVWKDKNGDHIKQEQCDKFKGSMLFASRNAFEFMVTSRRDDLLSLCYILVYLVDETQLKFIEQVVGMSKKRKFRFIKQVKIQMTPEKLCGGKNCVTRKLLEFVNEVFSIGFADEPNYNKLKFLLTRALLDDGKVPNKDYDWIPISLRAGRDDLSGNNSICRNSV